MVAAIIICFVLIGLLFWILAANNRNFAMDIESLCSEVTQLRAEIDALKKVDDAHYNDMAKFDGILSKLEARVVELESKQTVRKVIGIRRAS